MAARSVAESASAELRARWDEEEKAAGEAGRGERAGGVWRTGGGGALCSRRGSSGSSMGSLGGAEEEEEQQERGRGERKQRRVRQRHRRSMMEISRERERASEDRDLAVDSGGVFEFRELN